MPFRFKMEHYRYLRGIINHGELERHKVCVSLNSREYKSEKNIVKIRVRSFSLSHSPCKKGLFLSITHLKAYDLFFILLQDCFMICTGDSANAVHLTKKLRTPVTHIWGDRRVQPNRSAMEGPRPGHTSWLKQGSTCASKYALRKKLRFKEIKLVVSNKNNLA